MSSFTLVIESDGRELTFANASVSIGRDPNADLFIDHPTVSRQHALIVEHPNGHMLVVLSTTGMTAVDGRPMTGNVELRDGNRINFGQVAATFRGAKDFKTEPLSAVGANPFAAPADPTQPVVTGIDPMGMTAAMPGVPLGVDYEAKTQALSAIDTSAGLPGMSAPGSPGQGIPAIGHPAPAAPAAPTGDTSLASMGRPSQHGIVSWDEIAEQAATQQAAEARESTDYEKLREAAEKAKKGSGSSPIVPIAIVAIVGLMAFILIWEPEDKKPRGPEEEVTSDAPIEYAVNDLKCSKTECLEFARDKYRLGQENLKKKEADLGNTFRAFLAFDMTREYLKAAGMETSSKEFAELDAQHAATKEELESLMGDYRRRVHKARQRKQWDDLLVVLQEAKVHFPDKRSWGHRWAEGRELWMKEQGVMPKKKP